MCLEREKADFQGVSEVFYQKKNMILNILIV